MFNLFKPKVAATKVVESKPVNGVYPKIVHEIHNEFLTAGDKILEQAKNVLNESAKKIIEKGHRLSAIGFKSVPEVMQAVGIFVTDKIAKLVEYYLVNYPNNKFITEEQVRDICIKYNLFCGDILLFKGFVPDKNLTQIEEFKLKDCDKNIVELRNTCVTEVSLGWYNDNELPKQEYIIAGGVLPAITTIQEEILAKAISLGVKRDLVYIQRQRRGSALQICAPLKDMETKGMDISNYKISEHYPDPVVLHPVNGGYLIVTAWGDEASDELVVNQTNN